MLRSLVFDHCQGSLPQVLRATGYSPKLLNVIGSLQRHTTGEPYTLYQEAALPLAGWRGGPTKDKKELITVTNHIVTSPSYDQGRVGSYHLSAWPSYPRRGLGPPHARGLPDTDKNRPLRVSGSIGLKHRLRWDVTVGTHSPLAPCTWVGHPSRCHLMPLYLGSMTK
jgi:hypothetical protein